MIVNDHMKHPILFAYYNASSANYKPMNGPPSAVPATQPLKGLGGLTTVENAAPFVQSGKPFSLGPRRALVVLCVEQALLATSLRPVPVQFPVECITNDEPLLVSGYMYDVGAGELCEPSRIPSWQSNRLLPVWSKPCCIVTSA